MLAKWLSLMCLACITGCTHSHIHLISPEAKTQTAASAKQITEPQNALQVILTRSALFYSHAAVRLLNQGNAIFWDPAGTYGIEEERPDYYENHPLPSDFHRHNDLITTGTPDLDQYWHYSKFTGDNATEVFEWHLTTEQAEHYHALLVNGSNGNEKVGFITKTPTAVCGHAVSSFLIRHAKEQIPLTEHYSLPHGLSHGLHATKADRIYYYVIDEPLKIITPN